MMKPQATFTAVAPQVSYRPESAALATSEPAEAGPASDLGVAFSLGFRPAASRPVLAGEAGATRAAKQLLGTDFSHVIVTR